MKNSGAIILGLLVVAHSGCAGPKGDSRSDSDGLFVDWPVGKWEKYFVDNVKAHEFKSSSARQVLFVVVIPRTLMRPLNPWIVMRKDTPRDAGVVRIDPEGVADERGIEITLQSDDALRYLCNVQDQGSVYTDPPCGRFWCLTAYFGKHAKPLGVRLVSDGDFARMPDLHDAIDNN